MFIVYSPTPDYLEGYGLMVDRPFSGDIASYSLEGSGIDLGRSQSTGKLGEGLIPVKTVSISDGISTGITISQDCDDDDDNGGNTDDETNSDSTNNNGSNGTTSGDQGELDGSDHTDTGTSDNNPPDETTGSGTGDGGGGAQQCDFDYIDATCCNRGSCNPHPPATPYPLCTGANALIINCNGDRSATNTDSGRTNINTDPCPDEDIIIINPPVDDDCDTSKTELEKIFPDAPDATLDLLADLVNNFGEDFDIDTKEELDHFLAQAGHETGGLGHLGTTENTNYKTVNRLLRVFSSFSDFPGDVVNPEKFFAPLYVGDPVAIANAAYCCKVGNGDETSGDGYNNRGRGIFQLTFKGNYQAFQDFYNNEYDPDIDVINSPDLIVQNDTLAVLSAMWFYKENVLDRFTVDSTTTVRRVTKKINPALAGRAQRQALYNKVRDSLTCQN